MALSRDEATCRAELAGMQVKFEERPPLADEAGCRVDHPVAVSSLGARMDLEPDAVMNCATALQAAKFIRDIASPEAVKSFGSPIASIRQASAYVCRPRHGQTKLSEHAFGNALDIAGFRLEDGTEIAVKAYGPRDRQRREFLIRVRGAACGPFKTVLGPGSDADHAEHLHLDLAQRRNGSTYCQ